ncbi:MAG: hypothetical protein HY866_11960 [Chloroflexi bacterium]|nr:hypothetical protein [Chloroflexota bacterium]
MSPILDRYIRDLQAAGMDGAAGAVANIYNLFVKMGWVTVRTSAVLPKTSDPERVGRVDQEVHILAL